MTKKYYYIQKLKKILVNLNLTKEKKSILIALSGGQDSISLLFMVYFLQQFFEWTIGIVYCDHLWQSSSTLIGQELSVLSEYLNLTYYQAISPLQIKNEKTARIWRYQVLTKIGKIHNYNFIVTGHSASDQIETLVIGLLRKNKTQHISKAIKKKESLKYIRPLLSYSRVETKQICNLLHLPIWHDQSNKSKKFLRNRIRNQLLPYLRFFFNKNADQLIKTYLTYKMQE